LESSEQLTTVTDIKPRNKEAVIDTGSFFELRLEQFDGPIDLLLHLVKKNELPIEKIALAQVASQYMDCIDRMRHLDLEVAGEYLVIAATLLSVKSAMLLNEKVELVQDEDGNLVDPHEELLNRLREAEIYKQGAIELASRHLLGIDVFSSSSELGSIKAPPVEFKNHDPMLLGKAFKKLLDGVGEEERLTFTLESVSIIETMMFVLNTLKNKGESLNFETLVAEPGKRSSIIASFLALLELSKRQLVKVFQEQPEADIQIALVSMSVNLEALGSEFDISSEEEQDELSANAG